VPKAQLRERTRQLAEVLLSKNPTVLHAAKRAYKFCRDMSWEESEEYLVAKQNEAMHLDPEKGRRKGMEQFLDKKAYRPGLQTYKRDE